MANTIYSQGDKVEYGIKTFIVDTEEDKQNLSIRSAKMGSKCYVIDSKKWYILNGSYEWDPFVDAGGSGGSGSPFNIKGGVPTVNDLPTENNEVGDLYIVSEDHSEWVWLINSEWPNGYWEQLGSAILPSNIVEATGDMTSAQAAETRDNLGAAPAEIVQTVSGSTPTITPAVNTIYQCGKLTSLTISNPTASGQYAIIFFSGATGTVVTGIDNFTVEANKRYRINVQDGYATFDSWPYIPT